MADKDMQSHHDAEQTAFAVINRYIRFVDREKDKPRTDWLMNERWAWFIGENRPKLKLTTQPEPYTLERTLRWIDRQVAPTLKMVRDLDNAFGTTVLADMVEQAKLTDRHDKIIAQQVTDIEELIIQK